MTPEAPDTNEREDSPEARKRISLTAQENLTLMMADPDSPEVKAVMDAHGIEFGQPVEVEVAGMDQSMIVRTDKEDFWTRDRQASEALMQGGGSFEQRAAEHAKSLFGEEGEAGEPALEVAEELREEASEDLGEVAVEEVVEEVEAQEGDPSDDARAMKVEYDRRVDAVLEQDAVQSIGGELSRLDDEASRLAHTLRPVRLQDAAEQLRATIASIENDSYGVETARTRLNHIEDELASIDSVMRAAIEAGMPDIHAITERIRKQVASVNGELQTMQEGYDEVSGGQQVESGPDADTTAVRKELSAVSTDLETFAGELQADQSVLQEHSRSLHVAVGQLSEFIRQTYGGRVETADLYALYASLQRVIEGMDQVTTTRKITSVIETSRGHLGAVGQHRGWQ